MEFEKLKIIIETSPNIEFSQGVSDDIIKRVEEKLNFIFPKEYRLWLKKYGGCEINGEEVLGIFNCNFDSWPNIEFANLKMRKDGFISNEELAIQMNDQAEIYFFKKNDDKVFVKFGNICELYANSFFEFILKKSLE